MNNFQQKFNEYPPFQAGLFGLSSLVLMIGAKFIAKEPITIWLISASFLLLYSVMTNTVSIFIEDYKKYLVKSIYTFLGMFLLLGLFSVLLSGLSIHEAKPYRSIYLVLFLTYFIFISMVMMIKGLLSFLDEKDKKL
mgnify:CR=1 FL=1|jgi:hypothetical protein